MKVLSLILAVVLMQAVLLAPVEARVQSHSPHAAKSVHKHHAKQVKKKKHKHQARPKASLKSCMDRVGMNMVARDRCMRQHCEGRWGKGDCPAGADIFSTKGSSTKTPLGRCLLEAGRSPFKREACGWKHCGGKSDTSAECAALYPHSNNTQPPN